MAEGGVDGGNKSKGGLGTGPVAASPETDAFAYGIGEGLQERHAPVVSGPQGSRSRTRCRPAHRAVIGAARTG
jgi:hypothetical protein